MGTLDFNQYQELARRTQNPNLTKRETAFHAITGLISEHEELRGNLHAMCQDEYRVEETIKEAGDVCWMLSELCDCIGVSFEEVMVGSEENREWREYIRNAANSDKELIEIYRFSPLESIANLCGHFQKSLQGHEIDTGRVTEYLCDIACCLYPAMLLINRKAKKHISIGKVLWTNIDKLKKRYPNGFSEECSVNREE